MSGPEKPAREEKEKDAAPAYAAAGGGGARAALKLTDVAWIVAKNGYAADIWRCCGINREMWRWIDPCWTAEQAACVRRDHPFWQAIINLPHGEAGETRLILAAKRGDLARVEELIAWHADVNAVDNDNGTALIYASATGLSGGYVEVARTLLAAGAHLDATNEQGWTALIYASWMGHVEVVSLFLAAGADVNAANKEGYAALIRSSYYGHVDIMRKLLAKGAGVDVANSFGNTALISASCGGQVEGVRVLLKARANKHLIDNHGNTAHDCASQIPASTAAIRALLDLAP